MVAAERQIIENLKTRSYGMTASEATHGIIDQFEGRRALDTLVRERIVTTRTRISYPHNLTVYLYDQSRLRKPKLTVVPK